MRVHVSTPDNYWYGPNALPAIAASITIEGNGATIERAPEAGTPNFRLFYVGADPTHAGTQDYTTPGAGNLTLHDLTLQGGLAKGGDSGAGGAGAGMGGAIFNHGTTTLQGVTLTANTAKGGTAGLPGFGPGGGGIGEDAPASGHGGGFGGSAPFGGAPGGAAVTGFIAGAGGGGFRATDGGNAPPGCEAGGSGGGPAVALGGSGGGTAFGSGGSGGNGSGGGAGAACAAVGAMGGAGGPFGGGGHGPAGGGGVGGGGGGGYPPFTGVGFAGGGGGGFGGGGGSTKVDSAHAAGGGFGAGAGETNGTRGGGGTGLGGAIFNHAGVLTVVNSTLVGNTAVGGNGFHSGAAGVGGAIFNLNGKLAADFTTIAGNSTLQGDGTVYGLAGGGIYNLAWGPARVAAVTLSRSIVSGSAGGVVDAISGDDGQPGNIARFLAAGSLVAHPGPGVGGDVVTADPNLATELAANGAPGRPLTLALQQPSPAIDAAGATCAPAVDQRGFPRPSGSGCDLGAFEAEALVASIDVTVSGSQVSGGTPEFSHAETAPAGISVTGSVSCTTVDGGVTISPSLATGLHTIDASSCSGLSLSGPGAAGYSIAYAGGSFTVARADQTVAFTTTPPSPASYGGSYEVGASASSGLPVSLSIDGSSTPGACSLAGAIVHFDAAGICVIEANQAGNAQFNPAPPNQQPITVGPAHLTITASSGAMTYGGSVPSITPSFGGFVNGDDAGDLTAQPTCGTAAASTSDVGTYASSCSGAAAANYDIGYVDGAVTVNRAALTITASSGAMTYGGSVPSITPSFGGFVNGDDAGDLTAQPTCGTAAASTSDVGTYASSCSGAAAANYDIGYVDGAVTVKPAPLQVLADPQTKVYGSTNPPLTYRFDGFVNGDGPDVISGSATLSSVATETSGVGTYQIDVTTDELSATNYQFVAVPGSLTVTPAPLQVVADDQSRVYSLANPPLTYHFDGFVLDDDAATATTGVPNLATTATPSSDVGTYPISITRGTLAAANYTFTFVEGALDVTPAPTAIAARPLTRIGPPNLTLLLAPTSVSAKLTAFGQPVANKAVTFSSNGRALCTAVTDGTGTATCNPGAGLLGVILSGSYTAAFEGTLNYEPSTDTTAAVVLG